VQPLFEERHELLSRLPQADHLPAAVHRAGQAEQVSRRRAAGKAPGLEERDVQLRASTRHFDDHEYGHVLLRSVTMADSSPKYSESDLLRQSEPDRLSRVELPDGRVVVFRPADVVTLNLFEAERHARRGAIGRRRALRDLYRLEDGTWTLTDRNVDFVGDLAAAVLFSYAAVRAVLDDTRAELDGPLAETLVRLCRLHDELLHSDEAVGLLIRGDADGCAEDALAVVTALTTVEPA
jgi:hypothetical protein